MSIVIVGATYKKVIAMSDGRAKNFDKSIMDEYYPKVSVLNSYAGIGITGSLPFHENVFNQFRNMSYDIENIKADELFYILYDISKDILQNQNIKYSDDSSITIFGVTNNNCIEIMGFSTKDFNINRLKPEDNSISVQVLSDFPGAYQIVVNAINRKRNLPEGIKDAIVYISQFDDSVNSNVFACEINL